MSDPQRRAGCRLSVNLAAAVTLTGLVAAPAPARAENGSPLHRVTYTVIVDQPTLADVYFREVDPPNWADYSHNPYQFSPREQLSMVPGTPWVRDVMLARPDMWAMVTASVTSPTPVEGQTVRCTLAVDGVVVSSDDGPKGALCSIRPW